MHTANAPGGNARTFLTHMFGSGLDDNRYVVERFRSQADGDIRPLGAEAPAPKGRRKTKHIIVSLRTVEKMRPRRDEIIICTGLSRSGGVQYWGSRATGLFVERRQWG